jgi:hypothetical protein
VKLVTAMLTKNEAGPDRFLARVLQRCYEFSDRILVLDDNSTDDTCETALYCPKVTLKRRKSPEGAWGAESTARAELWEEGCRLAGDGWLLICDSDMLLCGDPRPLCLSWEAQGWAFPLADCWDSEDTARIDGPWFYGMHTPRPWLFNVGALPKDYKPKWSGRGIHAGHFPPDLPLRIFPTNEVFWRHMAYLTKEHRTKKYAQYQAVASQLTPFERQHAATIAD